MENTYKIELKVDFSVENLMQIARIAGTIAGIADKMENAIMIPKDNGKQSLYKLSDELMVLVKSKLKEG